MIILRIIKIFCLIFILLISLGCIGGPDKEARKILSKYDLHPETIPAYLTIKLPNDENYLALYNNATMDLGYNLKSYKGKSVNIISYKLKERSQYQDGNVYVHFLYLGNKIIGVYMVLEGYAPGIVSLNYKSELAPEKLKSYSLVFEDISKIELYGPWQRDVVKGNPWTKTIKISDPKEIKKFTTMLSKSKRLKHEYKFIDKEIQYGFTLYYKSGPEIRGNLYITDTSTNLSFHTFYFWHYEPPEELRNYFLNKLK